MFWICFCELSIGIVCVFFMGIRFALCCVGAEDSYPNETKRAELSVQLGLTYWYQWMTKAPGEKSGVLDRGQ